MYYSPDQHTLDYASARGVPYHYTGECVIFEGGDWIMAVYEEGYIDAYHRETGESIWIELEDLNEQEQEDTVRAAMDRMMHR